MTDRLWGCRLKLERAETHLNSLRADVRRFLKSNPYRLVPEFYADPDMNIRAQDRQRFTVGDLLYCVITSKILTDTPTEWGPRIGDILYSLRSALDHLAYVLAGPNASRQTEFPIFIDEKEFKRRINKIDGIHGRPQKLIVALQPYQAGKQAGSQPLWLLQELVNTDKHRELLLTGAAIFDPQVDVLVENIELDAIQILNTGAFQDGTKIAYIVCRFVRKSPNFEVKVSQRGPYEIAFDETGPARGLPLIQSLDDLLILIRDGIVPRFRRCS